MTPTITYGWFVLNGWRVRVRTTTYPPPSAEERARQFAAGQRTFRAGPFVYVEWLDDEPEADAPVIVEGHP